MKRRHILALTLTVAGLALLTVLGTATYAVTTGHVRASEERGAVDHAIRFVGEEVTRAAPVDEAERRFFATLSAANFVQARLSAPRLSLYLDRNPDVQSLTVGQCLLHGVGICGNHVDAFIEILQGLDVPVRDVQVYYASEAGDRLSHATAEVHWNGQWRFVDVSHGFLPVGPAGPLDVLSFDDIRAGKPYRAVTNGIHPWYNVILMKSAEHPLAYLEADLDVLFDGEGTIRPPLRPAGDAYGLEHLPAYIGRNHSYSGALGEIQYLLEIPTDDATVTLTANYWHCDDGGRLSANGDSQPRADVMVFSGLSEQVRLSIDADDEHCFVSVGSISVD